MPQPPGKKSSRKRPQGKQTRSRPKKSSRKRRQTKRTKRLATAYWLTAATGALHLTALAIVYATQAPAPQRAALIEMLWAHNNRPFLKAFGAWLVFSLIITAIAASIRGRHRYVLAMLWIAICVSLWAINGDRVMTAIRMLWKHGLN